MIKDKGYLEGLNTLRFIAAILVLIGHSTENLSDIGIYSWYGQLDLFTKKGVLAVHFFFVLSGFLLTTIAIGEYKKTGKINIKAFFLRRVFRIFPLYYLAVLLAYLLLGVVFPLLNGTKYFSFSIAEMLPLHILMLPNYVIAVGGDHIGSLYSLWSIGVEEQFYIFFPFLIFFLLKRKQILIKVILITISFFFIYWGILNNTSFVNNSHFLEFLRTLQFHFMLIGCVFSILIHNHAKSISSVIENKSFQLLIWLLFIISVIAPEYQGDYHILQAIVFALLILVVSNTKNRLINIERKPFIYLGNISYGIYIFHPLLSYPLRLLMQKISFFNAAIVSFPIIYYLSEALLTIIAAHFSYQYFEKYFLKKRTKYLEKNY